MGRLGIGGDDSISIRSGNAKRRGGQEKQKNSEKNTEG